MVMDVGFDINLYIFEIYKMVVLSEFLTKEFNLQTDKKLLTPIDTFKLYVDRDLLRDKLSSIKHLLSGVDIGICSLIVNPCHEVLYLLSQHHFNCYYSDIYFILSNPELVKYSPVYQQLLCQKQYLPQIADHIIAIYERIQQPFAFIDNEGKETILHLETFYNKMLINKFIDNLNFTYLSQHDIGASLYPVYEDLCQSLTASVNKVQNYLQQLVLNPKWDSYPKTGLSQFPSDIYKFAFQYHTGLNIGNQSFTTIKLWAQKHLDILMTEFDHTIDKILTQDSVKPTISKEVKDISLLTRKQKMHLVSNHPSQKWSSGEEMAECHKQCVDKYCSLYYGEHGFNQFNTPKVHVFNNETLAGGYFYQNTFYLNVADWQHESKYSVETLTLHETVPGHHMQIDYSMNSPHVTSLQLLFQEPFNGFIEGWGLFCENLGTNEGSSWSRLGYLEMNILRTFRVLAEIMLHVEGWHPEDVILQAKEYLTMSDKSIESEVYRYRTFAGQACSYKVGVEVINSIVKNKFPNIDIKDGNSLHKTELINFYKHLLWYDESPLQDLLTTYGLSFTFD